MVPSTETVCIGLLQLLPLSAESETEGPMIGFRPSGVVVLRIEAYWKCFGLEHVTTGLPSRALKEKVPGVKYPMSVNFAPASADNETPSRLIGTPYWSFGLVRKKAPVSSYPTTTELPHQALEVVLCVNPSLAGSMAGFDTWIVPPGPELVGRACTCNLDSSERIPGRELPLTAAAA